MRLFTLENFARGFVIWIRNGLPFVWALVLGPAFGYLLSVTARFTPFMDVPKYATGFWHGYFLSMANAGVVTVGALVLTFIFFMVESICHTGAGLNMPDRIAVAVLPSSCAESAALCGQTHTA